MKDKIIYVLVFPFILWFQFLFWYSMEVQGIEPKTGQKLYKYKQIGSESYTKPRGWVHIFKKWQKPKVYTGYTILSRDVDSYYPHNITK